MSHYSVAVFTHDDDDGYIELLAPFSEELCVPHITSKEDIIRDARKDIESFKNSYYTKYLNDPEKYVSEYSDTYHIKYLTEEFPKKLEWSDEECYLDAIKNYDKDDILFDGSVVSRYNPNSKWDWYQTGGRFYGNIPLKSGEFTDEAYMRDVDLSYRDEDAYNKALKFWQLYVDGEEPQTEQEKSMVESAWYRKDYYTQRYKSAEDYAEECASFTFYAALLPNSAWLEAGQMGWFGMSDASVEDEIRWRDTRKAILKKAQEEDWYITMVDCHI